MLIEVWAEGEIDIDNDNLSAPENFMVEGQKEASQIIFQYEFGYNELCLRRMDQCRSTRAWLNPGVTGGVDIIFTRLQLFELFPPK